MRMRSLNSDSSTVLRIDNWLLTGGAEGLTVEPSRPLLVAALRMLSLMPSFSFAAAALSAQIAMHSSIDQKC